MIVTGEGKRDSLKDDEGRDRSVGEVRKEHQLLLKVYCVRRQ